MSKFLFLGDFYYDYPYISDDIKKIADYIRNNNYDVILNLEGPVKTDTPLKKWINLGQSDRVFDVLQLLNVKAVCLANNHIMDYGEKGLYKTLEALNEKGISCFGAGMNLHQATKPSIIVNKNGNSIAIYAFGWVEEMCIPAKVNKPGVAPLKEKLVYRVVHEGLKKYDKVIVNFHWGYEFEKLPLPNHRALAHELIDMGVELIIGHHPHLIQTKEIYKNKAIYYSLGNFYFASMRSYYLDMKNQYAAEQSKYGAGVIWNGQTSTISFKHNESTTTIINVPGDIQDISDINMRKYSSYFIKHRTSKRKPILFRGVWGRIVNPILLGFNTVIENIRNCVIKTTKKMKIYESVKKLFQK